MNIIPLLEKSKIGFHTGFPLITFSFLRENNTLAFITNLYGDLHHVKIYHRDK